MINYSSRLIRSALSILLFLIVVSTSALSGNEAHAVGLVSGHGNVEERISPVSQLRLVGDPELAPVATAAATESSEPELIAAPRPKRGDYPNIGVSSRAVIWIAAQMHLFFAALVLAVPLFVVGIELLGVYTKDERYDDMAHEFMKISLTGYSITALLGGTLTLALFLLYPQFMAYMTSVFGAQLMVYAILFFLESFFLYVYYYGWDALRYGDKKWVHLSLGLMLNCAGLTIMVVSNSWTTFMMAPSGVNEVGAVVGNIWEVMKGPLWNPINL
ncbi:MAG: cytochrome ubiquinol oxidase subunit I, partial [Chromatiales bacterium]|nr:cytochrome ubiquinol oxidase subunit I [Chromatiales bacterium]